MMRAATGVEQGCGGGGGGGGGISATTAAALAHVHTPPAHSAHATQQCDSTAPHSGGLALAAPPTGTRTDTSADGTGALAPPATTATASGGGSGGVRATAMLGIVEDHFTAVAAVALRQPLPVPLLWQGGESQRHKQAGRPQAAHHVAL